MHKMDVQIKGRVEKRAVIEVRKCPRGGPPILIPYTRTGEQAVHLMDGSVIIIDLGQGYNSSRDAKYSDIAIERNKPWGRLP
jgi:hypothetical protein